MSHDPTTLPTADDTARGLAARSDGGQWMSSRQLEERRLIHRHDESMREQADAFRELRTRLLDRGGEHGLVILVVPVRHGCGGSFVARNLAAAFAFDETKQALLVDCDATHPTQAPALDAATGPGLMDYLEDEAVALGEIVHPTGLPRVALVPTGRIRETPGEAFSSFRMRALVDSLRASDASRHIILDGPPVQGSPDARILSDLADLVVLVVGAGQVAQEAVERAIASFPADKFAGVVFNQGA